MCWNFFKANYINGKQSLLAAERLGCHKHFDPIEHIDTFNHHHHHRDNKTKNHEWQRADELVHVIGLRKRVESERDKLVRVVLEAIP